MDNLEHQKYMNPMTFEAEMFVSSLQTLSQTYNNCDAALISSLEKVLHTIETFLNSNPPLIGATKDTKLLTCENVGHIKKIYHCSSCKTDLGKSVEKVTLHLIEKCGQNVSGDVAAGAISSKKRETNSLKDRRPVQIEKSMERMLKKQMGVTLTKKTMALLTADFKGLLVDQAKIGTKLQCLPDYETIENDLMALITPIFPNKTINIFRFGSRMSGIGTRDSDLDMFIDIDNTFNVFKNRADNGNVAMLKTVGKALKKHSKSWKSLVQIDKARVPILKVIHAATSIECDINMSHSMGIINTQFLEFIFNLQPFARLLCIFFKRWLLRTGLISEMNTYSIILMVIFFLQNHGILPSMVALQENINPEKGLNIGPWLCSYSTLSLNEYNIKLENINQSNLLKFIRGFFIFYLNFNYEKDVICPYLGTNVSRVAVENLMPPRYNNYVQECPDYPLQLHKPIVVQDPLQLNHNVTKGVASHNLTLLKSYMIKSLDVIDETFCF